MISSIDMVAQGSHREAASAASMFGATDGCRRLSCTIPLKEAASSAVQIFKNYPLGQTPCQNHITTASRRGFRGIFGGFPPNE
jgi:hypothetical protein